MIGAVVVASAEYPKWLHGPRTTSVHVSGVSKITNLIICPVHKQNWAEYLRIVETPGHAFVILLVFHHESNLPKFI